MVESYPVLIGVCNRENADMSATITWIGHASFIIEGEDVRAAIDPWKLPGGIAPVHLILVSHSHFDHYSPDDVRAISADDTVVCGPADVHPTRVIEPGAVLRIGKLTVQGVPAYNIGKKFHPRANHWLGFVVGVDGTRIYYAGDTDRIPEMADLRDIDVALLPVGGTYTMDAAEAARAAQDIGSRIAVPYHWGDIVGSRADAERFSALCPCEVRIIEPGDSMRV